MDPNGGKLRSRRDWALRPESKTGKDNGGCSERDHGALSWMGGIERSASASESSNPPKKERTIEDYQEIQRTRQT